ncbi:MAG: hypothetical protein KH703_01375 [Campylobacter gracilis]|uniref:hypothetical protein n=1 Tax=Campylobacter gracilis TaxID=824 RepID=UPI0026F2C8C1|nr:hypothetical protein [Campylobacter gracilis]MBS6152064.1 hypothetical protein [Campylobacter gracilis]
MLRLKYIVSAAIKCCALITKPYKGGVKFIAQVLREPAGLWIKDRNFAARRVKFWRNFGAKQRG